MMKDPTLGLQAFKALLRAQRHAEAMDWLVGSFDRLPPETLDRRVRRLAGQSARARRQQVVPIGQASGGEPPDDGPMTTRAPGSQFPLLYQVNPRMLLGETAAARARPPRSTICRMICSTAPPRAGSAGSGCWASGRRAWPDSEGARAPASRADLQRDLPDLRDADIVGSPFAIVGYDVHRDFGGDPALARLRERMHRRELRLLVDFVPNHVALDHPWVEAHPEFLIEGDEDDLRREPENYVALQTSRGRRIFAHGRDPNFSGWNDTLQLNYRHARPARGDARRAGADRRARGRRPLRHGDAARTGGHRPHLGRARAAARRHAARRPPVLARGHRAHPAAPPAVPVRRRGLLGPRVGAARGGIRLHLRQAALRPRCARARRGRCASTWRQRRPSAIERCTSSRTTTSRGRPPSSRPTCTGPPPWRRSWSPACDFSTRGNSKDARRTPRSTSPAGWRSNRTKRWARSTNGCWPVCAARRRTTAPGASAPAARPGAAIRPGTTSSPSPGRARARRRTPSCWSRSTSARRADSATRRSPSTSLHQGVLVLTDLLGDARYERDGRTLAREGLYLDLPAWGTNVFDVRPRDDA